MSGYLHRDEVTPIEKPTKREPTRRAQFERDLRKAAKGVRARSEGRCEMRVRHDCTGRIDEIHHVLRRSQGGTNDQINLLGVCEHGHAWIHANPAQARLAGLLAFRGDR